MSSGLLISTLHYLHTLNNIEIGQRMSDTLQLVVASLSTQH